MAKDINDNEVLDLVELLKMLFNKEDFTLIPTSPVKRGA